MSSVMNIYFRHIEVIVLRQISENLFISSQGVSHSTCFVNIESKRQRADRNSEVFA